MNEVLKALALEDINRFEGLAKRTNVRDGLIDYARRGGVTEQNLQKMAKRGSVVAVEILTAAGKPLMKAEVAA